MKSYQRRIVSLFIAISSVLVLTAEVALAGSGTGSIQFPNPLAPFAPTGYTESAFRDDDCSRVPEDDRQGFDAWVAPLEGRNGNYFVIETESMPKTNSGYTFHVSFYTHLEDKPRNQCHWDKGVSAVGNPTRPLETNGAEYAVVSVLAGYNVSIAWKECGNTNCTI